MDEAAERIEALNRQVLGLITKVQSGSKLGELSDEFCALVLSHLLEVRDLVLGEAKRLRTP